MGLFDRMVKRVFDIVIGTCGIITLSPFWIIAVIMILTSSNGGLFYIQKRVGRDGKLFDMIKFRTMVPNADKIGLGITDANDLRITPVGKVLRKYRLDELPQLLNVLKGDMSLVGPRPEIQRYTDLYNDEQRRVLSVKPGITGLSQLEGIHEEEELAAAQARGEDKEEYYIREIMPRKIAVDLRYVDTKYSIWKDISLIIQIFKKLAGAGKKA